MAEAGVGRQQRRGFLSVAALAAMALLAGCQSVIPKPRAPEPVAPPPPVVAPSTSYLPKDEARHRIALLVPLTGPNAAVGQSISNAANLALIDTGGKALRMTTYDTGAGAMAAAQRAIADGNQLFLGPLLATDVRLITPIARKAGVPIISFSNDGSVAGQGVYVLGFSPDQAVQRVVSYAKSRGITRFAGLMPNGLYGRNASKSLIKAAEAAGANVVAMQSFERSPAGLAIAIKALGKDQGYDAVLIADGGRIAVTAAPLIRKGTSPSARILGTELWNADAVVNASPALKGAWYASVSDGLYNQLSTKYRAQYGRAPFRLASLGYDAVLLATRVAAGWKIGERFPEHQLDDEGGFSGVDGVFRFGTDHMAERGLEVHEIGAGGGSVVSTAPRSFRD